MTAKLKKDGTPKKSGGVRLNTGPKMKELPAGMASWPVQLERFLRLAANQNYILPKVKCLTKSQVASLYGKKAADEFGFWFKSIRRFDQNKADEVRHRQSLGLYVLPPASWEEKDLGFYTPQKYANFLVKNKCFSWQSQLWDKHWLDVWMKYGDQSHLD
jgi:hypothetical protein